MSNWRKVSDKEFLAELPHTVRMDLHSMICGERISWGMSRTVFEHAGDEKKVIKIEDGAESFQNIIEWETWKAVEGTKVEKWFAPCYRISASGAVLIQARTARISQLPKKVPSFFCDFKLDNFGEFEGRIVCHDYGLNLGLSEFLSTHKKLKTLSESVRVFKETNRSK